MSHLTPDQFIDLVDGDADSTTSEAVHLRACEPCRMRLEALRAADADAAYDVPEPSPLFWDHLSARVREAIGSEQETQSPSQVRWAWTFAGAAVAVLLLAITYGLPRPSSSTAPRAIDRVAQDASAPAGNIAWQELPADDSWDLITDLTPPMDWDAASESGIAKPGSSERALLELSDDERAELARLLRVELARGGPG
jgi:hypothetical protein